MIEIKYMRRVNEIYSYLNKYGELPKPNGKRVNFSDKKSMNDWLRTEKAKYILTELASIDNRKAAAILDYLTLPLISKEEEPKINFEDKLREAASYNQSKIQGRKSEYHIFEDGTIIERWVSEHYDEIAKLAKEGNLDAIKIIKERGKNGFIRREIIYIPAKLKEDYKTFSKADLPNLFQVYKSILTDGYLSDNSFPYQTFRNKFLNVNYNDYSIRESSDIIKNLLECGIDNYIEEYKDFDEMMNLIYSNLKRSTKMITGRKFYDQKKVKSDIKKDLNWLLQNRERILKNTKYYVNANKLITLYIINSEIYETNFISEKIFIPQEEEKQDKNRDFEEALIRRYLNSIENPSLVKEPKTPVVIIPVVPDEKHLTKQI